MADLVRILETYCNSNEIVYRYGSKSHLNLLEGREELTEDKIHLLLFPVRLGQFNRDNSSRLVNGSFFYVMPDNFDRHYFNERNQPINESKYALKIEPLKVYLQAMEIYLDSCGEIDVLSFESVEAIDVLDANLTGYFVTYQFRIYE